MNSAKIKCLVSFALGALTTLVIVAAMGIRSRAQSAQFTPRASTSTNGMASYVRAVNEAIYSGTAATNLTEAERRDLMNDGIQTNLAGQLWFRSAMGNIMSHNGASISVEIRALENLRAGRTDDAIRVLEANLDDNILSLSTFLQASARTGTFQPTPQPSAALHDASNYRLKFPYHSGDAAADERVKEALSYVDKK